jgi:hypothetical protein
MVTPSVSSLGSLTENRVQVQHIADKSPRNMKEIVSSIVTDLLVRITAIYRNADVSTKIVKNEMIPYRPLSCFNNKSISSELYAGL